jgi:signal transduction histidine kinase
VNRLRDLYAVTRRWPVRLRIALVSATLTAVILIAFAAVVGRLTSNRIHNDFETDLQNTATQLAAEGRPPSTILGSDALVRVTDAKGNTTRVSLASGEVRVLASAPEANGLGPPQVGDITTVGQYEVASAAVLQGSDLINGAGPQYIQYARPENSVNDTISRLWFFLGGGVLIGTLLAGVAGMAVANRAMRPIAALTAAAGDIATTRDPSRRLPQPESDDEVAELARTLDQMLRELDAARSETDDAMQRQREFVADASHELRTPLTSILANLELLDHSLRADPDDDDRAAVNSALRSSKRMNRLVGDLLLLARADAGRAGQRAECDLTRIARDACEELAPVSDGHELVFESEGPVHVKGNPDELHRMVLNLLENAVRHTPAGTKIEMRASAADDTAELVVADDGPGLPEGMESQIFERFVRGQGPADRHSQNGTGTGLGLSIVRAVANAHGGDVTAANANGHGARFTVTLPLEKV